MYWMYVLAHIFGGTKYKHDSVIVMNAYFSTYILEAKYIYMIQSGECLF